MISLISPVETRAHHWPAGLKLLGLAAATALLFALQSPALHLAVLALVLIVHAAPGWAFLQGGLRALRLLSVFVVIVLLWHGLTDTLAEGVAIAARLCSAVMLANLVTMTTRLTDMMAALGPVLAPLKRVGLSPKLLELAMGLVIRMIPALLEKAEHLQEAWRARARRRASWRIVLPLTLLALDDADHVADALRARGGLDAQTGD